MTADSLVERGRKALLALYGDEQLLLQDISRRVGEYLERHSEADAYWRLVGDLRRNALDLVVKPVRYQQVKDENLRPREQLIGEILETVASILCDRLPLVQWFREVLIRDSVQWDDLRLSREVDAFAQGWGSVLNAPVAHKVLHEGWTLADVLNASDTLPHEVIPRPDSIGALLNLLLSQIYDYVAFPAGVSGVGCVVSWLISRQWHTGNPGVFVLPSDCAVQLILPVGLQPGAVVGFYRFYATGAVRIAHMELGQGAVKPSSDRVLKKVREILLLRRQGGTWNDLARQERKPPSAVKRQVTHCLRSLGCGHRIITRIMEEEQGNGETSREQ